MGVDLALAKHGDFFLIYSLGEEAGSLFLFPGNRAALSSVNRVRAWLNRTVVILARESQAVPQRPQFPG